MGGCAYGVLGEGPGYAILPDIYGVDASRFVTQGVGLAFSLVLFAGFWLLRGHWPFAGASFLMYVLLYFSGQFFLEFTRGDEAIYLGPLRLAQWLNLAFALAAAVGLLLLWWQATRRSPAEEAAKTDLAAELTDAAAKAPIEADPAEAETQEMGVQAEQAKAQDGSKETGGTIDSHP
jgi:hypothetical protein